MDAQVNWPDLDQLVPRLAKFYGLEIMEGEPVRGIYKLITSAGAKCLKKTFFPAARLRFVYYGLEYLREQGFTWLVPFFAAPSGQPWVQIGNDLYYLADWLEGQECNFFNHRELVGAVHTLAQFHLRSGGFIVPPDCKPKIAWGKWPRNFARCLQKLADYKALAQGKQKNQTGFDRKFLAWVDYFQEQGQAALAILEGSKYRELSRRGPEQLSLCHHDVAARNFITASGGQVFLIDWEFLRYDIRSYDLGRLIFRTLYELQAGFETAWTIMEAYQEVAPLDREEYPLLLALAYFPQNFWRVAEGYYKGNPSWTEREYLARLEAVLAFEPKRAQFLADFAAFCGLGLSYRIKSWG